MATADLLQAEARERPRMAVVAGLAALFTTLAPVIGIIALSDRPQNALASALSRNDHRFELMVSTVCSVLGLIALVFVLDFLYRATRARNPQLPPHLRWLPFVGGFGVALVSLVFQIVISIRLGHFATEGSQTYEEARKVSDFGAFSFFGIAAQLALAFAIVMLSINAMRVGLLTKFLGYLGVISAVLFILPLLPLPIVQIFWIGALALIWSGRGNVPPAWSTGKAEPWPSAQEVREQRVRAADARRGGRGRGGGRDPDLEVEPYEPDRAGPPASEQGNGNGPGRDAGARRKRKKRR